MTSFLKESFNSEKYLANRPGYPKSLYEAIMTYHQGDRDTVVDVGCGTGNATFSLLDYFENVIGCDPSAKMLLPAEEKREELNKVDYERINFKVLGGENLSDLIPKNSVDMVVGAESIQYADLDKFFIQAYRILRPGGTLAYWFYEQPVFLDYPEANRVFKKYLYDDKRYFDSYWPHQIIHIKSLGKTITIPPELFEDTKSRIYIPSKTEKGTAFKMYRNDYTLKDLRNLIGTWGSYHAWREAHKAGDHDIIDDLVENLKSQCGLTEEMKLRVEWPTGYYMTRKRHTKES